MFLFDISYHILSPLNNSGFLSDWEYCRGELMRLCQKQDRRIIKFNIFCHDPDPEIFQQRKEYLREDLFRLFGENCPAFGIIAQIPEMPHSLTIEAGTIKVDDRLSIIYKNYLNHPYVVLENCDLKALFANGLEDYNSGEETESLANAAFEKAVRILSAEKMTFDHVVRQWNYVGNILHKEKRNGTLQQHYQVFNEVRNNYYSRHRTYDSFPAATGIGMNVEGMSIDICAVKSSGHLNISSLNSPVQADPYSYSQKVLVGSTKNHKTAPQFERAKILMNETSSIIFISGTASIVGQKTIGINDVAEQTRITIGNIESLVSEKNLFGHSLIATEDGLRKEYRYIRVYVKYAHDIPVVRDICTKHFGDVPANFVQSDICRDDLLVEIEAELFFNLCAK